MALETIAFNIRYALRQFARNRGFAVTVIVTIALSVGLNTAMLSVIRMRKRFISGPVPSGFLPLMIPEYRPERSSAQQ